MTEDFSKYNAEGTPLREAQKASIDILVEFDRVCKKNNLTYWLDFGTLLGAVRHKGFIPWDDDIDLSMPLEDYNLFLEIGQKELSKDYFLQTEATDPGSALSGGIFKIRKNGTLFINDYDDFRKGYHKGASIDVFAQVPYPTVSKGLLKFFRKRINKAYGFFHFNPRLNFKNIVSYFVFPLSYLFFKGLWLLICAFKKKDRILTPIEWLIYGYPTLKSEMQPISEIEFEGRKFPAPKNPHARLTDMYGDYMAIPPADKRRIHAIFVCTDFKGSYVNL